MAIATGFPRFGLVARDSVNGPTIGTFASSGIARMRRVAS
jgi:hypothetical protein